MLFIFPTDSLFVGFEGSDKLLSKVDASLKGLVEAVILRWSELESDGFHVFARQGFTFQDYIETSLIEDFVEDPRVPSHVCAWLTDEDKRHLHRLLHTVVSSMFEDVIPILENLELNAYQLQSLKPKTWVGKSLVVDIVV